MKRKYNINLEEYNKFFTEQGGCCAICGKTQEKEKRSLGVDHNHKTKHIRGLLCRFCNGWLLKYFRDHRVLWEGFIKYAEKAIQEDKLWKYNKG